MENLENGRVRIRLHATGIALLACALGLLAILPALGVVSLMASAQSQAEGIKTSDIGFITRDVAVVESDLSDALLATFHRIFSITEILCNHPFLIREPL